MANSRELTRQLGRRGKVEEMFLNVNIYMSSPPQVGSDNHDTWGESGGEGDAREAASEETHAESCGEGGGLEENLSLVTQTIRFSRQILPGRRPGPKFGWIGC